MRMLCAERSILGFIVEDWVINKAKCVCVCVCMCVCVCVCVCVCQQACSDLGQCPGQLVN